MNLSQRLASFATLLLTISSMQVAAATTPQAAVADPIRNSKYPASNRQMLISSAGMGMNALLMRASGSGPKPTLLLLHGLPGNEQNLDLAQAVRRAGWNVLTMHYRGSWGSPGNFSIAGAVEDAEAAMAFLRQPDKVVEYGIDLRRVFIGGHSMGGFAAARFAAANPGTTGLVLIDAWNVVPMARTCWPIPKHAPPLSRIWPTIWATAWRVPIRRVWWPKSSAMPTTGI